MILPSPAPETARATSPFSPPALINSTVLAPEGTVYLHALDERFLSMPASARAGLVTLDAGGEVR